MVLSSICFIVSGIFAFSDPNSEIGHIYTQVIDLSIETNPEHKLNEETGKQRQLSKVNTDKIISVFFSCKTYCCIYDCYVCNCHNDLCLVHSCRLQVLCLSS